METPAQRGARVHAYRRAPSIDLVHLVELLVTAIRADATAETHPAGWQLFSFDDERRRLRVNTRGVLARLYQNDDFKKHFKQGEASGFLRDAVLPGRPIDARVGGRILEETQAGLAHAVSKLKDSVRGALDACFDAHSVTAASLVCDNAKNQLSHIGKKLHLSVAGSPAYATVVPLQFVEPERSAGERTKDVARLVSAVEEVETKDWLDNFSPPVRRKLAKMNLDGDDIDGVLANVKREAGRLDSQVVRFLNFLDDEALARVRLKVTFAIMEALKEASKARSDVGAKLLVRYVENVLVFTEAFCDSEESLLLDLSRAFGFSAKVNVSEHLRKALFYNCLPVWAEWVTQLFEFRPISSGSLARGVSYRFRINGDNPEARASAFLARLADIEEGLLSEGGAERLGGNILATWLAQVLFLSVVVPTEADIQTASDVVEQARVLATKMSAEGRAGVREVLATLKARNSTMDRIAAALVQTLRTKGKALVGAAEKMVQQQYICIQEDIVDWPRLKAATGQSQDFFIRPTDGAQSEQPLWFNHLVISSSPLSVPGLLFSVGVKTLLRERALVSFGQPHTLQTLRVVKDPALQVVWRPFEASAGEEGWRWVPREAGVAPWLAEGGVDIEVDVASIGRKARLVKGNREDQQQMHAAACSAFALLAYVVLWVLRNSLKAQDIDQEAIRTLMLRLQVEGKRALEDTDSGIPGTEVLYAVAQAVESALSCEAPTYMQGLVLDGQNPRFKTVGAFAALSSAFPLIAGTGSQPAVPKVALVSYATRPCDFHPAFPDADWFLYNVKTYVAEAVTDPFNGYELRDDRTQTHLQSKSSFEEPSLILEEIGRLRDQGCEHIMLLWHHYGNRHIGRTADRHAPHSRPEFLDRVAQKFPDITLYVLRRDVFPATRMRMRTPSESAFEVLRVREHEEFFHPAEQDLRRDLIPFYTFATLGFVGTDTDRPQSGFCTYFLEFDSRLQKIEWAERARATLIDPNQDSEVRPCLIAVLRGVHFLHTERAPNKTQIRPVLDPHSWVNPPTIGGAGELKIVKSRRRGGIILSLPALLTQVSSVLRGGQR